MNYCQFCGKPITGGVLTFKEKTYHATINERGEHVPLPETCFYKSNLGTRSISAQQSS